MARPSAKLTHVWQAPALFSFGFRPFFLFGALWAVLAMLLWLSTLSGALTLPTRFDPVSWHAHEFLFGYLGAVLAGFLLTAVPNWTGRFPIRGWPLAALFGLWVAGRIAILTSATWPDGIAAAIDLAFLLALDALILREIVAGKNWHNLIVLALLAVFTLANALFHVEWMTDGHAAQGVGLRLGIATAVMTIAVIGGRIIPSFTRNWLVRENNPARPAPPMQRFDKLVLLVSIVLLALWVGQPPGPFTTPGLVVLGMLHLARLIRWQGHHTFREPLVWILHVSYGFIPAGALSIGLARMAGISATAAVQHLWMAGAIGAMTLAVMTRATLGHTGQNLTANRATLMIYLCLFGSVLARLCATALPELSHISGILWVAAFGGFVLTYGSLLLRPKPEKRS
ncbi:uncharacterized protein involved in response to NO [Rhodovulum imhoffii]|uniref:Uncharacterized protein involved in response to NO n=1 Tax=Rhodovulum imhoffii TaxID=365340 RepID=A0A2T5BR25_9RHOB|nr:NnrS family protein [Rhodovulum imhoffii]MBK5932612.1 short-chain dehydrogenase [Rhodovulum imhoffii]PTN01605.1 uncharacterized protein involved in response to NO [Rhodovulum imhoffii]